MLGGKQSLPLIYWPLCVYRSPVYAWPSLLHGNLHLPLLNSMIFSLARSSCLLGSLWIPAPPYSISTTPPQQFVSSKNPTSVCSRSLSRSMIKMLIGTGPSIDAGGMPLVTSFQLDLEPLTTTLWAQQSSQFFTHLAVYPFSPRLLSLATSILWKTVLKSCFR